MEHTERTHAYSLFDELPLAHIRVDLPVLDGEPVLGFSIRGVDVNGAIIAQTSWSAGAFTSSPQMLGRLVDELLQLLTAATATMD